MISCKERALLVQTQREEEFKLLSQPSTKLQKRVPSLAILLAKHAAMVSLLVAWIVLLTTRRTRPPVLAHEPLVEPVYLELLKMLHANPVELVAVNA